MVALVTKIQEAINNTSINGWQLLPQYWERSEGVLAGEIKL
jgi:hypothetical protein